MNLRDAIQEYPNKSLEEVFMDKLKDDDNGDKTFTVDITKQSSKYLYFLIPC
jgi:hypothetical protein